MSQAPPSTAKPRPALFRALGKQDPPPVIDVDGKTFQRVEIYKHDSWAATALYQSGEEKIVCKFNRQQSILGLPMRWLGRCLARRESRFYQLFADLPAVPKGCGTISAEGRELPHAAGHAFVEGRPLRPDDRLPAHFFADLKAQLAKVHERGVAYMDLHKRENIILGRDGRGYLIDFQVSFGIHPKTWFLPARWLLRLFQSGDRYHMIKHELRHAQNAVDQREKQLSEARPWWIRMHRLIAQPLRSLRRMLLVRLGIRQGNGRAQSEHFTEDGLRHDAPRRAA